MSQGGDSGSGLLVKATQKVIGLHFAGSADVGISCKIANVLPMFPGWMVVSDAVGGAKYGATSIKLPWSISKINVPPPPGTKTPILEATLDHPKGYRPSQKMNIAGTLKDPDTGKGLEERQVEARSPGFAIQTWRSSTDPDGNFLIPRIMLLSSLPDGYTDEVVVTFRGDP